MHAGEFVVEQVYQGVDAEGGASDALGRILRKRLKPLPLSPYKTNIHITPQLVAMVKTFSFSSNGDKTYAGCTKGITIFAVPWRTAEAINEIWPRTNTSKRPRSSRWWTSGSMSQVQRWSS